MKEQLYKKLMFNAIERFFKDLKTPITSRSLKKSFLHHPDYTSLVALSDVCEEYKIEHLAIDASIEILQENGFPVLTHIIENDIGLFVVVKNMDAEIVSYYHPQRKKVDETLAEFQKKWSQIAFYAFPDRFSGEENYKRKHIEEILLNFRFPVFILSFIVLIGYSLYILQPIVDNIFVYLFGIKLIGLFFCVNLVLHSLGQSTNLTNRVCEMGKHASCDVVLNSPAAKLFGFLSMSDIGLVYFVGSILAMFISLYSKTIQPTVGCLLFIAICTAPYILFSVIYQVFVIRKWCPLCISVMTTLLMEGLLFLTYNGLFSYSIFHISTISFILFSFIIVLCMWSYLKSIIMNLEKGIRYEYAYSRLKKNLSISIAYLNLTPPSNMQFSNDDIVIGNIDAEFTITVVLNTHCGPCAIMHKKIMRIISKNREKIKLILRFMVSSESEGETLHLLELYYFRGNQVFEEALVEWFEKKDRNCLKLNYPVKQISPFSIHILEQHKKWCDQQLITYTPIIYLNNKKLRIEDDIIDIEWFVRNILDS